MALSILTQGLYTEQAHTEFEAWLYGPDPDDVAEFEALVAEAMALSDDDVEVNL